MRRLDPVLQRRLVRRRMLRVPVRPYEGRPDLLMRILIDGGCWSNARGYGRFTRELLAALARAPRHEYIVVLEERAGADFALPLTTVFVKVNTPTGEAATSSGRR